MTSVQTIAIGVINVFLVVLLAQAVASWFPGARAGLVQRTCAVVTDPVVAPVRRLLPPLPIGGGMLDLSFLVVFLVARLVLVPVIGAL